MVHVFSITWRINHQPSNSISCCDNALRLSVLVRTGILYWGLQMMSSFSIRDCTLKGSFERGIFWSAESCLKVTEDFNLEHCQSHELGQQITAGSPRSLVGAAGRLQWFVVVSYIAIRLGRRAPIAWAQTITAVNDEAFGLVLSACRYINVGHRISARPTSKPTKCSHWTQFAVKQTCAHPQIDTKVPHDLKYEDICAWNLANGPALREKHLSLFMTV
jgi:hypothetical protein